MVAPEVSPAPLKIALLMRSSSRINGGIFEAGSALANALAADPGLALEVFAVQDKYTETDRHRWGLVKVNTFPLFGPSAFSFALNMSASVRAFRPLVVHQHGLWTYTSIASRKLARTAKCKVLLSVHGMLAPWALAHQKHRKGAALLLYENANLQNVHCIHATTEAELEQLRNFGLRQPVAVIPLGVVFGKQRAQRSSELAVRTLLSLGRLHPVKGLDNLIRAWAAIAHRHPAWQLQIAGPSEGGYGQELEKLVLELNCPRVQICGPVYGENKDCLFASADVFVLPSHSENFALTVLEALAHGLPVLASRKTPWSSLPLKHCGWWVDTDVPSLSTTLDEVMNLPTNRLECMGRNGRTWAESAFSWSLAASKARDVYRWLGHVGDKPDCVVAD